MLARVGERRKEGRAQDKRVKGTKDSFLTAHSFFFLLRAVPEGGDRVGIAWSAGLMKNRAHSEAVTIDFSFQAACKLPQESMSEGENKFLKLAWSTSREKPSTSQIVMKRKPEQGVIARREGGRQAAHPGATCHRVGHQSPYGRASPSGKYTHCHHK